MWRPPAQLVLTAAALAEACALFSAILVFHRLASKCVMYLTSNILFTMKMLAILSLRNKRTAAAIAVNGSCFDVSHLHGGEWF